VDAAGSSRSFSGYYSRTGLIISVLALLFSIFALGFSIYADYAARHPQLAGSPVQNLDDCFNGKLICSFDWTQYDALVPALEAMHYKPGFWKEWRRSTNVEVAGQGRYRP
jgi:hypothetical protein